ncbi:MAG: molybdopterin molybdotransferase MoeA [Bacteroidia bacterium]|nr:molybdopterin molybdotransferase MoeA [Bacteroidia bacterium]
MISFHQALGTVRKCSVPLKAVTLALQEAFGLVLAEDIKVRSDAPPFHQSAMDGYAFSFRTWDKKSDLKITGLIPAGKKVSKRLKKGEAALIFTGAEIPAGADTVVIREKVVQKGEYLRILDTALQAGANIRKRASHIRTGQIALKKGTTLNAGAIAFLASVGIARVKVISRPRVGIIVTGDELAVPGQKLAKGQVYECNSFALHSALRSRYLEPALVMHAADDKEKLKAAIRLALAKCDVLLLTGGVSAGDFDFVAPALQECGFKKQFHKVRQKPGKPLFFGTKGKKLAFGLPGNPASVLTCYYVYVVAALNRLAGISHEEERSLKLNRPFSKKPGMTHLLKAKTEGNTVSILHDQESYKLNSFAMADALVLLDEETEQVDEGREVVVIKL